MASESDPISTVIEFRGKARNLAEKHREEAPRGLGYLAIALAAYADIGLLAASLPGRGYYFNPDEYSLLLWSTLVFTAASITVFLITRSGLSVQAKMDIGLVYQVLGAFGKALDDVYRTPAGIHEGSSVSLVILWVTVFPIVAPSKFGRSFVTNVLTSLALVFAYLALSAFVPLRAEFGQVLINTAPLVIVALIATIPVYFLNRLSKNIEKVQRMGSYQLIGKLGEGGMGEVWKARHRMLAHETAIKLIKFPPAAADKDDDVADTRIRRFEREARTTAALRCTNTVRLYDFGVTENGAFYYVMEYLDGINLRALVSKYGPLDAARTIHLLRQICDSLIEAHEAGLVHRDIKPANVFLCRKKPHYDVIKVLDFGLVKRSRFPADETRLTTDGMLTGTPAFMAPEIIKGDKDIDGRADIYSVGCVAYWLLTGRLVFEENGPMKVILAHVGKRPDPPSMRTELEIPPSLERLILRCLEKAPDDRPRDARELERSLSGIGTDSDWDREQAEHWWLTHMPSEE